MVDEPLSTEDYTWYKMVFYVYIVDVKPLRLVHVLRL